MAPPPASLAALPPVAGAAALPAAPALGADWRDYVALMKPKVMRLVVFTAACGLIAAPGPLHPVIALAALLCIAAAAGASGALNMWYEADIDAKMRRTASRPLPAGRMAPASALEFGVVLAVVSVLVMGVASNWLAAALLAGSIGFYVFIYTMWLKRRTPQNIVIGGAAGAFPPLIGWVATTGSIDLLPLLLFAIVFMWTPPHFWALALFVRGDYANAGVPMMPVVAGEAATRRLILLYSLALAPLGALPWALGLTGPAYGIVAIGLGLQFLRLAFAVARNGASGGEMRPEKRLFAFSILYLFGLFAALVGDALCRAGGVL